MVTHQQFLLYKGLFPAGTNPEQITTDNTLDELCRIVIVLVDGLIIASERR
jgi:hypothetical protein